MGIEAADAVQQVQGRARTDAAVALVEARHRAERWGSDQARRLVRRTPGSGEAGRSTFRVPLASRPLRDWYLHVYDATLREIFGRPTAPVTAADIETTAAEVGRLTPNAPPEGALRITAVLAARATKHAIDHATQAYLSLGRDAAARAPVRGRMAGIEGVSAAIMRAWYQRCFLDAADFTIRDQPLRAVTAAEATLVAEAVASGQTRRIVGADGIVAVTQHSTMTTHVDRRLAAGEVGVIDRRPFLRPHANLAGQVRYGWSNETITSRRDLIGRAGVDGVDPNSRWAQLPWPVATTYIRYWLDTHRSTDPAEHLASERLTAAQLFEQCRPTTGPPAAAAAQMFNLPPPTPAASGHEAAARVRGLMEQIVSRRPQTTSGTAEHPPGHLSPTGPAPGIER